MKVQGKLFISEMKITPYKCSLRKTHSCDSGKDRLNVFRGNKVVSSVSRGDSSISNNVFRGCNRKRIYCGLIKAFEHVSITFSVFFSRIFPSLITKESIIYRYYYCLHLFIFFSCHHEIYFTRRQILSLCRIILIFISRSARILSKILITAVDVCN